MKRPDRGMAERSLFRLTVGGAHLAVAAMLLVGVGKYFALVAPRYGRRFAYVAVLMVVVACWLAVRGVLFLSGRARAGV